MTANLLFATFLFAVSAILLYLHFKARSAANPAEQDEREQAFQQRQFRRRFRASGLIGFLGLMVLGGIWIEGPIWITSYWAVAAVLVLWMGLLGLADLISTRRHYNRLRAEQLAEHAKLMAEVERIRGRNSNGKSRSGDE